MALNDVDSQSEFEFTEAESTSSDDDDYSDPQADHLDLGPVIRKLDKLTHLSVQYRVCYVERDFEWDDFLFTGQDCLSFSKVVGAHKSLTVIELKK